MDNLLWILVIAGMTVSILLMGVGIYAMAVKKMKGLWVDVLVAAVAGGTLGYALWSGIFCFSCSIAPWKDFVVYTGLLALPAALLAGDVRRIVKEGRKGN